MWNVVHKKKFRVCQWSGQLIGEDEKIYRVPEINSVGKVEWKGCYATPNCALAAIKKHSDERALPLEKHAELISAFQNSLVKIGGPEHIDIKAAPNPLNIAVFGGTQSVDVYRDSYDPGKHINEWFEQNIAPVAVAAEDQDDQPSSKTSWKQTIIGHRNKCNDTELQTLPQMPMANPRNMLAVVNFLKTLRLIVYPEEPTTAPFVVYTHPTKDILAVGALSADAWSEDPASASNLAAYKLLGGGNRPLVFGDVVVLHKKPLKFGKQRRNKKPQVAEITTEQAVAAAQAAQPAPPKPKKTKSDSGSEGKPKRKRARTPDAAAPAEPKPKRPRKAKVDMPPIPKPLPLPL